MPLLDSPGSPWFPGHPGSPLAPGPKDSFSSAPRVPFFLLKFLLATPVLVPPASSCHGSSWLPLGAPLSSLFQKRAALQRRVRCAATPTPSKGEDLRGTCTLRRDSATLFFSKKDSIRLYKGLYKDIGGTGGDLGGS